MDEPTGLPPDPPPPETAAPEVTPAPEPAAGAGPAAPEPAAGAGPAAPEPAAALESEPATAPEHELAAAPEHEPLLLPAHGSEAPPLLPAHETEAPLPDEPPHAAAEPVEPEHDQLAREHAQRLEAEIAALRTGHADGAHRDFRAFFAHERKVHELFKELRPLHPHDRHRLWKSLQQAGAETRRAQQEQWESRRYQSIEARETVDEKLRAAEALTQAAEDGTAYRRAESMLNEIRNLLSNAAPGSLGQLLIGPDRRACWDHWRSVRDALRKRHGGRQEQAYSELIAPVQEIVAQAAEADPFQVTQRIKEIQARLGKADLRRGQFEELRRRLSAAWQQAQGRMSGQRHERSQQRAEWRGRMGQHLGRWTQSLEQKRGQLEHLVGQAAKLIEMERHARSEEFAEQVRQWQAATAEKRRRAEESIAELEKRIRETEKRVGGRAAPAAGATAEDRPKPRRRSRGRRGRKPAEPSPPAAGTPEGPPPAEPSADAPAGQEAMPPPAAPQDTPQDTPPAES
jgi:hypothetical protein